LYKAGVDGCSVRQKLITAFPNIIFKGVKLEENTIMSIKANLIFLTVSQSLNQLTSLLVFIALSRTLSQADYGTMREHVYIIEFAASILLFGLSDGLLALNKDPATNQKTITNISYYIFISTTIISLFFLLVFRYDFFNWQKTNFMPFHLVLYAYSMMLFPLISSIAIIKKRIKAFIYFILLTMFVKVITVLLALFHLVNNVNVYMLYTSLGVVSVIYYVIMERKAMLNFKDISLKHFVYTFKYTFPLGLSILIKKSYTYLDKFVVSAFYNSKQLAIYANGSIPIPFVDFFNSSVNSVYLKHFADYHRDERQDLIYRDFFKVSNDLLFFYFGVTFGVFMFASNLITFTFSSKYIASIIIFKILLIRNIFKAFPTAIMFIVYDRRKLITLTSVLTIVINIILIPGMKYLYGINGLPYSIVITEFIVIVWQLVVIGQIFKNKNYIKDIFVIVGKYILICLVACGVVYVLQKMHIPVLLLMALWAFIYLFMTFALGLMNFKEMKTKVMNYKFKK